MPSANPNTPTPITASDDILAELDPNFLQSLGKRVRNLRDRRAITRKVVATDAKVSERHLAQLEAGEGNVSIVLLGRIAGALNVVITSSAQRSYQVNTHRCAELY